MSDPIIKVENISKKFSKNILFEDMCLNIYPGEVLGILGLSGCGKSTFLNMLCGFIKPNRGEILFKIENSKKGYIPVYNSNKNIKAKIGFSAQNPSFYDELSVYNNLKYFAIMQNVDKNILNQKIEQILEQFELTNAKHTISKNLSEGMKKRLDLACSIIHDPKLLVLDEPTSNLDFKLRTEILKYIKKINQAGVSIIFVSHFISEMEEICTNILMIKAGKYKMSIPQNITAQFEEFLGDNQK